MSIKLPEPIAAYFAATNAHDVDAMLARFAKTAIVKDEGKTMRGADAVRQWIEETIRKYAFSVEALATLSFGSTVAAVRAGFCRNIGQS